VPPTPSRLVGMRFSSPDSSAGSGRYSAITLKVSDRYLMLGVRKKAPEVSPEPLKLEKGTKHVHTGSIAANGLALRLRRMNLAVPLGLGGAVTGTRLDRAGHVVVAHHGGDGVAALALVETGSVALTPRNEALIIRDKGLFRRVCFLFPNDAPGDPSTCLLRSRP
jgi:hypothetical protein